MRSFTEIKKFDQMTPEEQIQYLKNQIESLNKRYIFMERKLHVLEFHEHYGGKLFVPSHVVNCCLEDAV